MEKREIGFTLIELMIVVGIIAFLAVIGIPSYMRYVNKAKRSEATLNLGSIYTAQKAYWAENGTYTNDLTKLGWKPEGVLNYTYGFSGSEGTNFISGKLKVDIKELGITKADNNSFIAGAVADLNGTGKQDLITINEKREINISKDGL